MRIEAADIDDAEQIVAVQHRAFGLLAEHYGVTCLPPMRETAEECASDFERGIVLKAVESGRVVGSVRARQLEDGTVYVARLSVEPEMGGRGIGRALAEEIERRFPLARRFELFTGPGDTPARRVYDRLGYRVFRTQPTPEVELLWMEKIVL